MKSLPKLFCALGCWCAFSANGQDAQVIASITTMVNAIDAKKWQVAENQFTDQVRVDYSSLFAKPASTVTAESLVGGWQNLLSNVSTHHMLTNFDVSVKGDTAQAYSHVYASHLSEDVEGYWDVFGRYHHSLEKVNGQWKINSMTLITHGQKGNTDFFQDLAQAGENVMNDETADKVQKVEFLSAGERVVGDLYYPEGYEKDKTYPAVIVSGSWTTVKEQMAGLYAKKLADEGFITLAFDFRHFGESEGEPRFHENPSHKIEDISNAVTFMQSLPQVDSNRLGALGICAGSMYTLMAAAKDKRIQSVVTVASWLHDSEAVKLFYGGEEGVQAKITAAQAAKQQYTKTGIAAYIPTISTTDESAAMYGPYDYYLNPERGAISQWSVDKFAIASWEDWLTLDPMPSAQALTAATLMIHSDGAVLPQYTKKYFEQIAAKDKRLHWLETDLESPFHQFSFYDQQAEVDESIAQAAAWLRKTY